MEFAQHTRQLLAKLTQEPEPLLEAISLCGPDQQAIAKRLGVTQAAVSQWTNRHERLTPARRAELEALAREVFLSSLEETRIFFNANPRLYRTDSAKRWRQRLARARELLREAGVKL
jgi:DNA-binding transcriptional regulator YdaS (Cro superfamily)